MAYSDIDDFLEGFPSAQGNEIRANDALEDAAALVQRYAPAPVPLPTPDDYSEKAARAERRVAAYLFETGGYLSSKSAISPVGGSKGFRGLKDVLDIVEVAMAPYYVGEPGAIGAANNTAYISSFSW